MSSRLLLFPFPLRAARRAAGPLRRAMGMRRSLRFPGPRSRRCGGRRSATEGRRDSRPTGRRRTFPRRRSRMVRPYDRHGFSRRWAPSATPSPTPGAARRPCGLPTLAAPTSATTFPAFSSCSMPAGSRRLGDRHARRQAGRRSPRPRSRSPLHLPATRRAARRSTESPEPTAPSATGATGQGSVASADGTTYASPVRTTRSPRRPSTPSPTTPPPSGAPALRHRVAAPILDDEAVTLRLPMPDWIAIPNPSTERP